MSERKFNVGDRVRIIRSGCQERIGVVATIAGPLTNECPKCGCPETGGAGCYPLDLQSLTLHCGNTGCPAMYAPASLEPYYDGNEKVSWSSCEWQPKGVRA